MAPFTSLVTDLHRAAEDDDGDDDVGVLEAAVEREEDVPSSGAMVADIPEELAARVRDLAREIRRGGWDAQNPRPMGSGTCQLGPVVAVMAAKESGKEIKMSFRWDGVKFEEVWRFEKLEGLEKVVETLEASVADGHGGQVCFIGTLEDVRKTHLWHKLVYDDDLMSTGTTAINYCRGITAGSTLHVFLHDKRYSEIPAALLDISQKFGRPWSWPTTEEAARSFKDLTAEQRAAANRSLPNPLASPYRHDPPVSKALLAPELAQVITDALQRGPDVRLPLGKRCTKNATDLPALHGLLRADSGPAGTVAAEAGLYNVSDKPVTLVTIARLNVDQADEQKGIDLFAPGVVQASRIEWSNPSTSSGPSMRRRTRLLQCVGRKNLHSDAACAMVMVCGATASFSVSLVRMRVDEDAVTVLETNVVEAFGGSRPTTVDFFRRIEAGLVLRFRLEPSELFDDTKPISSKNPLLVPLSATANAIIRRRSRAQRAPTADEINSEYPELVALIDGIARMDDNAAIFAEARGHQIACDLLGPVLAKSTKPTDVSRARSLVRAAFSHLARQPDIQQLATKARERLDAKEGPAALRLADRTLADAPFEANGVTHKRKEGLEAELDGFGGMHQATLEATADGQAVTPQILYPNYALADTPLSAMYGDNVPALQKLAAKYDPGKVMTLSGVFHFQ